VFRPKNRPSCEGTDVDMWFPEGDFSNNKLLKRICDGCPAKAECLEYSLHHNVIGFWAGTTYFERRLIRKQNNIKALSITPEWDRRNG